MKSKLHQRLKRVLPSGQRQKRGVAILTVLAIISLMTVLVISFFNMAQTQQTTAKGTVEIQRVASLRDTILNLVIAQVREATTLEGTRAEDFVVWSSQPGAIRTYSGTDITKNKLYKLYSSDQPQISNINPYASDILLSDIMKDLATDWDVRYDEFVDINRPVFTVASGSRAIDAKINQDNFSYPIADPRRYSGTDDPLKNTEGFDFSKSFKGLTLNGVDPRRQQLAMPVRWIYVLRDGTLGYIKGAGQDGQFTALTGGTASATVTNPIVGRMAWWADDESCKVNVNTASVPAIWDIPRTTSREDRDFMATRQPLAGEFQRCPGHPATTDISAVLYPGKRWTPNSAVMPQGESMDIMPPGEAELLWTLAPYIKGGTDAGTNGGQIDRVAGNGAILFDNDDYIYTSFDEMYFRAASNGAKNVDTSTPRPTITEKDTNREFLTRLEQSQFFLTHKSHSPEVTMHGFPRISMYPMNSKANEWVGKPGLPPGDVSPLDVAMAVNSTIGGREYYTQREDPTSRHAELYTYSNGRNILVFKYLKELSRLPIPGYPEIKKIEGVTDSDDTTQLALATKYSSAYNNQETGNKAFQNTKVKNTGNLILDASDRTQILFSMLDYTRSVNMKPGTATVLYDLGLGQATGFCGCSNGSAIGTDHANAMSSKPAYANIRVPKGLGRVAGVAEVAMIINVAASRSGDATPTGEATTANEMDPVSKALWDNKEKKGLKYLVEIGFVVNGFCPKLGWSPMFPGGGITVSSGEQPTDDARSPGNGGWPALLAKPENQLPIRINNGKETIPLSIGSEGNRNGVAAARTPITDLLPQGGMLGPRALLNGATRIALCKSVVVQTTESSGSSVPINLLSESTQEIQAGTVGKKLRIHVYDNSGAGSGNVIQQIELSIPTDMTQNLTLPMSRESLGKKDYVAKLFSTGTVPGNVFIKSWVVPHGDYRLSTTPIRVEKDIFVPHGNYKGSKQAYSFWEPNTNISKRKYAGATYSPLPGALMLNPERVKGQPMAEILGGTGAYLPPPYADMTQLKLAQVTTKIDPKVGEAASASSDTNRSLIFRHGRLDGHNISVNRGASDPTETGDFDNGTAETPDGPYLNATDDGDLRTTNTKGYFAQSPSDGKNLSGKSDRYGAPAISPNFLIRSPVDFGSIPTGIQARVPWQTLRFRPDPGMNRATLKMNNVTSTPPLGLPFANFCGPRDHFFLDMFWMPVVEPWSISEPFSTKGTINMNQQIYPFMYVNRTTGLHALLRGERMMAIHNDAVGNYKKPDNSDPTYRYFINAKETVKQFTARYAGMDAENEPMPFNAFRSASEICEMWLVPDRNTGKYETGPLWNLNYMHGTYNSSNGQMNSFWAEHLPTGDNSRERPYANLYPRVTTRSNVYKVHLVAQSLQKGKSTNQVNFDSTKDAVTGEWRGSAMIERSIDPRDAQLASLDYVKNLNAAAINPVQTPRIDNYYIYRVTEVKQLTE